MVQAAIPTGGERGGREGGEVGGGFYASYDWEGNTLAMYQGGNTSAVHIFIHI